MALALYIMFLGHLDGYRDDYLRIATTFATTIMVKLVVKSAGNKDHAQMVGIGGGFVTISQVLRFFGKLTSKGFEGKGISGTGDTGNGLIGELFLKIVEQVKDIKE